MSEETSPRTEDAKDEEAKAAPLRPVSPYAVVYDGPYAYKLQELRDALPEKERPYLDELRGQEHKAARERVRHINEHSPKGTPPLRYSKDVADAHAWRIYHHRHHYSADRALASVQPVGNAPSRQDQALEREPRLVTTESGERVSYNDLRAAARYPDAVDDARDAAHDKLGRAPSAQETWDSFKKEWPGDARQAEADVVSRGPGAPERAAAPRPQVEIGR